MRSSQIKVSSGEVSKKILPKLSLSQDLSREISSYIHIRIIVEVAESTSSLQRKPSNDPMIHPVEGNFIVAKVCLPSQRVWIFRLVAAQRSPQDV